MNTDNIKPVKAAYKRKTIQTYIALEQEDYNKFIAMARMEGKSAAALLGEIAKKTLDRYWNGE